MAKYSTDNLTDGLGGELPMPEAKMCQQKVGITML